MRCVDCVVGASGSHGGGFGSDGKRFKNAPRIGYAKRVRATMGPNPIDVLSEQPCELVVDVLPVADKEHDNTICRSVDFIHNAVVSHPNFPESRWF